MFVQSRHLGKPSADKSASPPPACLLAGVCHAALRGGETVECHTARPSYLAHFSGTPEVENTRVSFPWLI